MPKFKAVIREQEDHKTKDGTYDIKIRVTHNHKTRYIGTGYYVLPEQFSDSGEVINHDNAAHYNIQIRNRLNLYDKAVTDLGMKIHAMDMKTLVTHLRGLDPQGRDTDFLFLADKNARHLHAGGRVSYAKSIEQTISEIKAFSGPFLAFRDITPEYLERFQMHLRSKKKSVNTAGIHLRNIRMIYNKAIDAGKADLSQYPFRRFKIKTAPSRDRDLDIEDIRKIKKANLKLKAQARARDLFMLSFYLCGINFKDMLHAQKKDIIRGRLEISRIKTGQPLSIKIEPEAQEIIDRYPGKEFVLGILEEKLQAASKGRKTITYKDVTDQTNRNLKNIADGLVIPERLSTYHARHTWSSIAFNECEASEEIIALALGHASQRRVTAGYIRKKYDQVDRVNRKVIDLLLA